ncbi:putative leucine-rich repeat receptor-like protein kinase, partial [Trifolium medium]|nr:putative leucine-rich repeat receptor-like protein kinase [Trifolium medium]
MKNAKIEHTIFDHGVRPIAPMSPTAKRLQLFESNNFDGRIPSTLGLVQKLEVVRLDNNSLTGSLPQNLNNLTKVRELFLSHNRLSGSLPDLTGMNVLSYL